MPGGNGGPVSAEDSECLQRHWLVTHSRLVLSKWWLLLLFFRKRGEASSNSKQAPSFSSPFQP